MYVCILTAQQHRLLYLMHVNYLDCHFFSTQLNLNIDFLNLNVNTCILCLIKGILQRYVIGTHAEDLEQILLYEDEEEHYSVNIK